MTEDEAKQILLVRALEEEAPESVPPELRAEAWRAAGEAEDLGAWLLRRARFVLERLPEARRALAGLALPPAEIVVAFLAAASLLGLVSNGLSRGGRIHLLANPVTALLVWNFAVYAVALAAWLWREAPAAGALAPPRGGLLHPLLGILTRWSVRFARLRRRRVPDGAESARVRVRFAGEVASACAPLLRARCRALVHGAAIAFALGALAGITLQGVAFSYTVEWGSTLVESPAARASLVAALFLPARIVLGEGFPGTDALAEAALPEGAPAAVWFQVFGLTVLACVILPRALLALSALRQARALARAVTLPLDDPSFRAQAARPAAGVAGGLEKTVLSHFALDADACTVLASLQAALVTDDIGATKAGGAFDTLARKKAWFERWRGLVARGFGTFPDAHRPAIVDLGAAGFAAAADHVRSDGNAFAADLVLLELAAFEAYWPLEPADVGWRERLGLSPSLRRSVRSAALASASLRLGRPREAGEALRRDLGAAMRDLSGLWPKIAVGAAAGTAVGALTAGIAAPLAAPFVGKAVGAAGLMALKAGLAALGGHAVVAAGLGAAGGSVVVAGGGVLLGQGAAPAGLAGGAALTPASAILSSAKIEVFLRDIVGTRPAAAATVLPILAELQASVTRLREELPAYRLDPTRTSKEIQEREKVIGILERVAARTEDWARRHVPV